MAGPQEFNWDEFDSLVNQLGGAPASALPHVTKLNPFLEQENKTGLPLLPGGGQLGPSAPAKGASELGAGKPTLHVGKAEYKGAGDLGFDIYKASTGGKVYYHYHPDGTPWFATKHITGQAQETDHISPEQVEFPAPSGIKSSKPAEAPKPTLHEGGHLTDIIQDPEGIAQTYDMPGGYVIYHHEPNGKPIFAEKYNPVTGENDKFAPSEVNWPSLLKAVESKTLPKTENGKPILHQGEPQFSTLDSAHYKTRTGNGTINFHWAPNGKPWFADYLPKGAKYGDESHITYEGETVAKIAWPKKPTADSLVKPKIPDKAETEEADEKFNALLDSSHPEVNWGASHWQHYKDLYEEHHAPFDRDEREALNSGASSISGKLWKDQLGYLDEDRLRRMQLLDSAMDKSSIPADIQTWSGVNKSIWEELKHMEPGEISLHKGYMSTSLDKNTAAFFRQDNGGLIRLHIPKGSRGVILGKLAPMPEEHEVQLPRGTLLRKMAGNGESGVIDVEVVPGIGAFHGSHANFEKFDLSKAGSGEGTSQVESFTERPPVSGGFMAEAEPVARKYQRQLAEEKLGDPSGGWLYKIHVKAHPKELLDWNKPLRDQSPQVQEAFKGLTGADIGPAPGYMQGKQLLDWYGFKAIEKLRESGVKGIRFLDKYSRQRGYGTQNYVIFDDNIMQIIGKKGSGR